MARFRLFFVFFALVGFGAPVHSSGGEFTELSDEMRLRTSVERLILTRTGRFLVSSFQAQWGLRTLSDFLKYLQWGSASRTDAVLTRRFDIRTGQETRERQITIYLRHGAKPSDLVLDLAHELVHATARPSWDPYDPELTPVRYVLSSIEGEGGEVDALIAECQVEVEMTRIPISQSKRCSRYLAVNGIRIDREKVKQAFYRVGNWFNELRARMEGREETFPLLSDASPLLYSSTGKAPYPVSLLAEYKQMTQIACENSKKREIASSERLQPVSAFLNRRCKL